MSDAPLATVAILTHNPGIRIEEVLEAVCAQRTEFPYEVLVIDSGSTDDTDAIIRRFGVRFVQIEPEDFQHGRTRNLAVELASGAFVAFLTHDATPASPFWLQEMIDTFDLSENVGAVFGPHLPRPDCDVFTARELLRHFQNFSPDGQPQVHRIIPGPEGWDDYREREAFLGFFSDVNGCLRRSAWDRVPFREVDYAEDQRFGRDLLEAGYAKIYQPAAAVYHSHAYGPREYFHRMYDEFVGLKRAVGYEERRSVAGTLHEARRVGRDNARYARSLLHISPWRRWRLAWLGRLRAFLRLLACYLAVRHERIPRPLHRRLSLEFRTKARTRLRKRLGTARHILVEEGPREFGAVTLRRLFRRPEPLPPAPPPAYLYVNPASPAPLSPRPGPRDHLTINWVVPPFGIASGGHMTISRIIRYLEQFGHRNRLYLYHASEWLYNARPETERALIRSNFQPVDAEVFIGVDEVLESDVLIATSWETAYVVHQLGNTSLRGYLVQDFEPYFYPVGSEHVLAETTYRFDFRCLTAGPWLSDLLRSRYGVDATPFDLAPDHSVYRPLPDRRRDERTVLFYARWTTERRGFELGAAALQLLAERDPDVRILFFGAERLPRKLPFEHRNLGIMTPAQLARLYNEGTLGFVISLTNPSLIPFEMMACGLPVLDVAGDSTRGYFGAEAGSVIALADPDPVSLSEALHELLKDQDRRQVLATEGSRFAATLDWETSARQVEAALQQALADLGSLPTDD